MRPKCSYYFVANGIWIDTNSEWLNANKIEISLSGDDFQVWWEFEINPFNGFHLFISNYNDDIIRFGSWLLKLICTRLQSVM